MLRELTTALRASLVTFVLCAAVYPAIVWGMAALLVPEKAAGSLVSRRVRTVMGSSLLAQGFSGERYFHPRPSAVDYKADAAGASNYGPNHPALRERIEKTAIAEGATTSSKIPADLVTASGSGLDPHISPEAARFQAKRVATARKKTLAEVETLIEQAIDRSGSLIGAPARVNVLLLNLALDGEHPSD